MQIILIHPRKAGAMHLSRRGVFVAIGAALLTVAALSVGGTWLAAKQGLLPGAAASAVASADQRVTRENLNLMAARIGEMQAQIARLDALGPACRAWPVCCRASSISNRSRAGAGRKARSPGRCRCRKSNPS